MLRLFFCSAQAQDKLTFLTSWYAQVEHGGFSQALAKVNHKQAFTTSS